MYQIGRLDENQVNCWAMSHDFDLYPVDPWEVAGVRTGYFAFDDSGELVGFLLTNDDNLAVAIEVMESHRGYGVAASLLTEAGCHYPERNENPDFWSSFQKNLTR